MKFDITEGMLLSIFEELSTKDQLNFLSEMDSFIGNYNFTEEVFKMFGKELLKRYKEDSKQYQAILNTLAILIENNNEAWLDG